MTASLNKYSNRAVEAAQVIAELIEMAKKFREELERGIALGLTDAEVAFYDALANNPSAQELMKEDVLATIARELAETLRNNVTIDWQNRESVRARLRLLIRTKLRRYKYPPDQQENAIDLVLQQAEVLQCRLSREVREDLITEQVRVFLLRCLGGGSSEIRLARLLEGWS